MRRKGDGKGAERVLMVNNAAVMHYQCGGWQGPRNLPKGPELAENTVYSFPIRYNIAGATSPGVAAEGVPAVQAAAG